MNMNKINEGKTMSDKNVEARVTDIIVDQLGVDEDAVIAEASFMDDLGADSLDSVELIMALEEEFSTDIPDEEAEKLRCVGDVLEYIESRMN